MAIIAVAAASNTLANGAQALAKAELSAPDDARALAPDWCNAPPPAALAELAPVPSGQPWFDVYRIRPGVFALYEPKQYEQVISYLIIGAQRALLFDTGLGIGDIATLVRELTPLPVTVLNSHTHFDHVGGNADFARILAVDTEYTRANTRGFSHAIVAGEIAPASLCAGLPPGFLASDYCTRPYRPREFIHDGHRIDLGARALEVLQVPGHTPDAIALLDRARGLLFTGDTFYEGQIWLTAPETDFSAYARSVGRLAALAPTLRKLLPAHNVLVSDPKRLIELREAVRRIRAGTALPVDAGNGQVEFSFEGFSMLTTRKALRGPPSDPAGGGSGLARPERPGP
jgi:glyoxylase-like metal-dependent hydrolase (beta-lactamase superfamily II)